MAIFPSSPTVNPHDADDALCRTGFVADVVGQRNQPRCGIARAGTSPHDSRPRTCVLVVQDIFPTETVELADVVFPAAAWGEKTGTFTNTDRTVHISEQAVQPPGEATSDLAIFLDYAQRMDFRDKRGDPLPPWRDPEQAFEAWKQCAADRPCDYSGITYDKLRGGSGIQWPCNESAPEGTERLYADGTFWSAPEYCESYGKDLITGAVWTPEQYRAMNPDAKAIIKNAEYIPASERPDEQYPFVLITGRTLYHFHTRTKTGRVRQLHDAAPQVWAEISGADADTLGIGEGDLLEIGSPRGVLRAPARISGIRTGVVFVPFHYGYRDTGEAEHNHAANEITRTAWDPVSNQPLFKTAAAAVRRCAPGSGPALAPTNTASAPRSRSVAATYGGIASVATETIPGLLHDVVTAVEQLVRLPGVMIVSYSLGVDRPRRACRPSQVG